MLSRSVSEPAAGSFSLAASAILPALLLGVWWKRANGRGALAGMMVPEGVGTLGRIIQQMRERSRIR